MALGKERQPRQSSHVHRRSWVQYLARTHPVPRSWESGEGWGCTDALVAGVSELLASPSLPPRNSGPSIPRARPLFGPPLPVPNFMRPQALDLVWHPGSPGRSRGQALRGGGFAGLTTASRALSAVRPDSLSEWALCTPEIS